MFDVEAFPRGCCRSRAHRRVTPRELVRRSDSFTDGTPSLLPLPLPAPVSVRASPALLFFSCRRPCP